MNLSYLFVVSDLLNGYSPMKYLIVKRCKFIKTLLDHQVLTQKNVIIWKCIKYFIKKLPHGSLSLGKDRKIRLILCFDLEKESALIIAAALANEGVDASWEMNKQVGLVEKLSTGVP